jgi:hypothetical protein
MTRDSSGRTAINSTKFVYDSKGYWRFRDLLPFPVVASHPSQYSEEGRMGQRRAWEIILSTGEAAIRCQGDSEDVVEWGDVVLVSSIVTMYEKSFAAGHL